MKFLITGLTALLLIIDLKAQSTFSSEFIGSLQFRSAEPEEILINREDLSSTTGHYSYQTKEEYFSSMVKDSIKIINFLDGVKEAILSNKIQGYRTHFSGDSSLIADIPNIRYIYNFDTSYIEDEFGNLTTIPETDTLFSHNIKRIDLCQEWYYNLKENKIDIDNIWYSPKEARYDETGDFKGMLNHYYIKQGELSSLKNQKKWLTDKDVIWAQRIKISAPISDMYLNHTFTKTSSPLKSIMNAQLGKLLFNRIISGEIKAFKPNTNHEYLMKEIDSIQVSRVDTEYIENEWGDLEIVPIVEPYLPDEVGNIIIKQELIFDNRKHRINSKVKSIIIPIRIYDTFGKFEKNYNLFEVRFY